METKLPEQTLPKKEPEETSVVTQLNKTEVLISTNTITTQPDKQPELTQPAQPVLVQTSITINTPNTPNTPNPTQSPVEETPLTQNNNEQENNSQTTKTTTNKP